jgi:D-amino-acid dehydrogenase
MRVAVLGAGVIGVTTAQALAGAGHQVTVIDRQPGVARETSFANGGQISACHAAPWAAPHMPFRSFKLMFQADAPLRINPLRWDPALWGWCLRFLANCTAARFERNMERALRVAVYSRSVLKALRQRHNLNYGHTTGGLLYLYRDQAAFTEAKVLAARLSDRGLNQVVLDRDGVMAEEPALARSADPIAGGFLSPDDETGDAHAFSEALVALTQGSGVSFLFNTPITGLAVHKGEIKAVETPAGPLEADAFVVCLGSDTARLLTPLGLRVPIYPAKGYSITAEITEPEAAPRRSITDEGRFMVLTRMGNKIRSGGTAELAGWDRSINPKRLEPIIAGTRALFPDAADYSQIEPWCGLRPATPDSVPIIGPAEGFPNLFLNAGHGTLGWTMACGSAQAIADLISGRTPEIDLDGLGLDRF